MLLNQNILEFESNEDILKGFVLKPKDFDENMKYPAILDIHDVPKTDIQISIIMKCKFGQIQATLLSLQILMDLVVEEINLVILEENMVLQIGEDLMSFADETLKRYENIDKDKLAVTLWIFYGGFMTNWIITHTDRFKARIIKDLFQIGFLCMV